MIHVSLRSRVRTTLLTVFILLSVAIQAALAQEPLTFAVVGDSGEIGKRQREVAVQLDNYRNTKGRFDFVLMLGDNVYPDGVGKGFGEHFEKPFKELLDARVKFYAVLGNHDIRKGTQAQISYPNFNMGGRRFYSFTAGGGLAEFFALDSTPLTEEAERLVRKNLETLRRRRAVVGRMMSAPGRRAVALRAQEREADLLEAKVAESETFLAEMQRAQMEQIPWLVDALQNSTARWKVVFLHHSIFSSAYRFGGHGKDSGVIRLRRLLQPILVEKKVNVVFAGHDHVFEQIKPQGPAGGHKVYYVTEGASAKLRKGDLDKRSPTYEFGVDNKYSFLVVRLTDAKMAVEAVDSKGNLLRSFVIPRLP